MIFKKMHYFEKNVALLYVIKTLNFINKNCVIYKNYNLRQLETIKLLFLSNSKMKIQSFYFLFWKNENCAIELFVNYYDGWCQYRIIYSIVYKISTTIEIYYARFWEKWDSSIRSILFVLINIVKKLFTIFNVNSTDLSNNCTWNILENILLLRNVQFLLFSRIFIQ